MKKSEIPEELKDGSLDATSKLLNALIIECHEANEINAGEEVIRTQGEIRAYRKLKKYIKKALTGDK